MFTAGDGFFLQKKMMSSMYLTSASDGENSERPQSLLRRWHTALKKMSRYNYSDKLSQIIIGWNKKKAHAMPGIVHEESGRVYRRWVNMIVTSYVVCGQTGIIARGVKSRMCNKFKELHKQLIGLGEPPAYIDFWYQHFLVEGNINKPVTGGTLVTGGVDEVI